MMNDKQSLSPVIDVLFTAHTARCTGITSIYLSHIYDIVQMMHASGHKIQKTSMGYIKLSSEEIADNIAARTKKDSEMW